MAKRFYVGSYMATKVAGFSLTELMVSVAIIAIMTTFVVTSLGSAQQQQYLTTASRVVAGDLRSLQASALTAQNIPTCLNGSNKSIACALTKASCAVPSSCTPQPPQAVGVAFKLNQPTYAFFAELNSPPDYADAGASEEYLVHNLAVGSPNVVVGALTTTTPVPSGSEVDVSFQRQNGQAQILVCNAGACTPAATLTITLKQTKTNATTDINFNPVTGRVSFN